MLRVWNQRGVIPCYFFVTNFHASPFLYSRRCNKKRILQGKCLHDPVTFIIRSAIIFVWFHFAFIFFGFVGFLTSVSFHCKPCERCLPTSFVSNVLYLRAGTLYPYMSRQNIRDKEQRNYVLARYVILFWENLMIIWEILDNVLKMQREGWRSVWLW